jgi:dTDP-4-dehydrorhamnose reductase
MLGADVTRALLTTHSVLGADLHGPSVMDVCDAAAISSMFSEFKPEVVIHCAAMTDVDACEGNPEEAYRVNTGGTWNLAEACRKQNARLCYISTDYVFDGEKGSPYDEFDAPNPLGHYGRSKLAGELCVARSGVQYWIVRTSWLFGLGGKCFPQTMLHAFKTQNEVRVVDDQVGSPTYTIDLAEKLKQIVEELPCGVYHVCNDGTCSWFEFAEKLAMEAGWHGKVRPIPSSEWPTPTRRPRNSSLRRHALELLGKAEIRRWQDAAGEYVREWKIADVVTA